MGGKGFASNMEELDDIVKQKGMGKEGTWAKKAKLSSDVP